MPLNKSNPSTQAIQDEPLKEGGAGPHSWPFPEAGGWNLTLSNTRKYKIEQAAHSGFPRGGSPVVLQKDATDSKYHCECHSTPKVRSSALGKAPH